MLDELRPLVIYPIVSSIPPRKSGNRYIDGRNRDRPPRLDILWKPEHEEDQVAGS